MKYLLDDRLAELTGILSECPLPAGGTGGQQLRRADASTRVLHGRIEAFTTKRTAADKRFAIQLGQGYMKMLQSLEDEWAKEAAAAAAAVAAQQEEQNLLHSEDTTRLSLEGEEDVESSVSNDGSKTTGRKRSHSTGVFEEALSSGTPPGRNKQQRGRNRAVSLDLTAYGGNPPLQGNEKKRSTNAWPGKPLRKLPSVLGDFCEPATRRLLTDLILTLNMSFPDYDFESVQPQDFVNWSVVDTVKHVSSMLADLAVSKSMSEDKDFLAGLWSAVDDVIHLKDCEVYSYQPAAGSVSSSDDDPLSFLAHTLMTSASSSSSSLSPNADLVQDEDSQLEASNQSPRNGPIVLWSFNFLFVNKSMKRILLFTCIETMKGSQQQPFVEDEDNDEGYGRFANLAEDRETEDFDLDPTSSIAGGIPVSTL